MILQHPQKASVIYAILGTKGQRCREVSQLVTEIQVQICLSPKCVLLTPLPHCSVYSAPSTAPPPREYTEQVVYSL